MDWGLDDVVLLHVTAVHDRRSTRERRPVDATEHTTVAGISRALGFEDGAMSNSVQLLSAITSLTDQGLVEERVVDGDGAEHKQVYVPTETGRENARDFERALANATVTVDDGTDSRTVPASDVGAVVDGLTREACLARLVHGSTLYRSRVGSRLVGRDDPFDRLLDAFDAPDARTAFVRGSAGVGKTALVAAFTDAIAGDATVLVGDCDPTVRVPYGPVSDALADSDAPGDDERPLADGSGVVDDATVEDPNVVAARATEFREELVDALAARAAADPLVLVVEDLQWADAETVTFLEHLATTAVAALVVGTYRPGALGESHPLRSSADVDVPIELGPLDHGDTATFVSETVGLDAVPGSFVDRVYDRTGGNPLFVEETLAQLPTSSVLDGGQTATELAFPTAVEEAVRETFDALDDTGFEVLECAALAGRSVPRNVLERVVDAPPTVVDEYVSLFVDGRYLEANDDDVVFANEQARAVLQDGVDPDRNRAVHERLASAFAAALDEDDASHDRVAYHHEQAGDYERAYEHFVAAAERAVDVYAHETAVERYASAMQAAHELGDADALLAAIEAKGKAHLDTGDYDDADQAFEYVQERASDRERERMAAYYRSGLIGERDGYELSLRVVEDGLAEGPRETTAAARLLGQRGWAELHLGELETAIETFQELRDVANALDDDRLRAQANDHLGVANFRLDRVDRATEYCERAVELIEPLDDVFTLGKYLNHLAMTISDRDRSAAVYERALDAHREAGDVVSECDTLTNLGFIESKADPAASLSYFERSAERAERLGYTKGVGAGNLNAGTVQIPLGELAAARERLATSRDVHEGLGRVLFLHGDYDGLATVDVLRGDTESAHEYATRGLEIANDVGRDMDRVDSLVTLGDALRARVGPDAGRRAHEHALELARSDEDARSQLFAHLALAGDDVAVGASDDALEHADAAASLAAAEGDRRRVASAAYRRGVAARGCGDHDTALDALDRAIDVARDRDLRLVECAAAFERARVVDAGTVDPASTNATADRERARALVASTGATRLQRVAGEDDGAVPTSV
jgi:tetratricopeptide (TPR) repeat protein